VKAARAKRVLLFASAVLFLFLSVAAYISTRWPHPVNLPDHTAITLRAAKVGFPNEFKHGTRLEKVLGSVIPTNGWKIASFSIQRPDVENHAWPKGVASLTLQFQLTGQTGALQKSDLVWQPSSQAKFRILHWGDDGYAYAETVSSPFFRKRRDGYFAYLTTAVFARSSKQLHVELQEHDPQNSPWLVRAKFDIANPHPAIAQEWKAEPLPTVISNEHVIARLGPVQVQQSPNNSTLIPDFWLHAVVFPFQFFEKGRSTTNWTINDTSVDDSTGNYNQFETVKSVSHQWTLFRASRSANPSVPWRLKGHFTKDSGFADSYRIRVSLHFPWKGPIQTNLLGVPTTIDLVQGSMLAVNIPTDIRDKRILFVDALDDAGKSIAAWTRSWNQHGLWESLNLRDVKTIRVEMALVPDIPFEVTIQPTLVPEITIPEIGESGTAN